ncbi:MAG: MOSC domain-containing protein [Coraliomargarita sp.]
MNRPAEGEHVPVDALYLDVVHGIQGDRWERTAWLKTDTGAPDPRVQVSLTNTSVIRCFTGEALESQYLCGDNCYVNLNLTEAVLPVGSRLQIGNAVIEVSDVENDACGKFAQRFGVDALKWVRRPEHLSLRLRGIFCRIEQSGWVRVGDHIKLC